MDSIKVKTTVPGLSAANSIMAKIKQLGIQDVELMFDKEIEMWAIVQVFRPSNTILLMNSSHAKATKPIIMWWVKKKDGTFRTPDDNDLHDIVVTVNRAHVIFDKGSDWMVDKLEKQEQEQYEKNRKAQSEKIRSYGKSMKRAIRKELL